MLVVAFVTAGVAVPASPALAVEALPPAIADVPILPGAAQKSWHSAAGGIGNSVLDHLGAMYVYARAKGVPVEAVRQTPITAAAPVARAVSPGAGAAGVLTGAQVGWALGQGGLAMWYAATDAVGLTQDGYEGAICNAPDWYQGANSLIMLGVSPSCPVPAISPNQDVPAFTMLGSVPVMGSYLRPEAPTRRVLCMGGSQPSGWLGFSAVYADGTSEGMGSSNHSSWMSKCPPGLTSANGFALIDVSVVRGGYTVKALGLNNQVVASSVTSQPDPFRSLSCRIAWSDGTVTYGFGTKYTEGHGVPLSTTGTGCSAAFDAKPGAGTQVMPEKISVDSELEDGGAKTTISDQQVPAFSATEKQSLAPGPVQGLRLLKVVDGVTDSCMTWAADCAGWWPATSQGTSAQTSTGTYRCTFAGGDVELSQCAIYQTTFDSGTLKPQLTDPETGQKLDAPLRPSLNTTDPGTEVTPGGQCMAEWASVANPIEWVLQPVKCALVWAFVPRQSVVDDTLGGVKEKADSSAIGALGSGLTVITSAIVGVSGCGGLPFHLSMFGVDQTWTLFDPCAAPWPPIAAVTRGILGFLVAFGAFLAILRYAASLFGFTGFGSSSSVRFRSGDDS